MGATSSRTANQNTLTMVDGDNQVYWTPNVGEFIKSIVETTSSIKVYARLNTLPSDSLPEDHVLNSLTEYTFSRSDVSGWILDSSSLLLTNEIVGLETSNQRDLNGDSIIGLTYAGVQPISGVIKGSLGSKDFYFAGLASRGITTGTTPLGIDTAKLLKNNDESGSAWQPQSASGTMVFDSTITDLDFPPETAEFVLRTTTSLAFFNDQYQFLSELQLSV